MSERHDFRDTGSSASDADAVEQGSCTGRSILRQRYISNRGAMIGANFSLGMMREFTADCWGKVVPKKVWYNAYDEAEDMIRRDVQMNIRVMI